ncbi:hypothetical protein GCM10022236_42760 [Microlunatus ginsengisoli]|uniref:Uncharacterized protein n=1 Tax=Microlunatus ginsengisoli TaxID=363863 RepID=A0ABP7AMH6_9ACTN
MSAGEPRVQDAVGLDCSAGCSTARPYIRTVSAIRGDGAPVTVAAGWPPFVVEVLLRTLADTEQPMLITRTGRQTVSP